MSQPPFTDTERMDYLAHLSERTQGQVAGTFRAELDAQIRADRAGLRREEAAWLDLTVEFPPDDVPVRVRAGKQIGRASYCSMAGEFYISCPGTAIHGRLWTEVFGREPEITHWQFEAIEQKEQAR